MENKQISSQPEIWGGIECTINRIGDHYKDQLEYSGHYTREGDIAQIASLGIKALRYPVLWEKHQPQRNHWVDWRKTDQRLDEIRAAGVTPVIGLMHHGSGPSFTHLLDPEFPDLLADYAYEVASRYPWIDQYTPVNEPLTTARFSGLYGHWYPHQKNERSFYRMLFHQLKATVLAMEGIRTTNPEAKLIQTEDLGKTHSTSLLSYQADFENIRRLLTFDLLTGSVKPGHPHYDHIVNHGITEKEIDFFQEHLVRPDLMGLNYYITSERWLDEHLHLYPASTHGGNGRHVYSDTEIVRAVYPQKRAGFKNLAREIWDRYHIPLAATEVHLHCTREDQMRWLKEIWDDASCLREEGVDLQAVTPWSMLGSFDWNTLLTQTGSQYESGVFDIQTLPGRLRPTALAGFIKNLRKNERLHPVLKERGWWQPSGRYLNNTADYLIILGQNTGLFRRLCLERRLRHKEIIRLNERDFQNTKPWAVIDCTYKKSDLPFICARNQIQYVDFSSHFYGAGSLNVPCDLSVISIPQANRVLDFLIDGEYGQWTFDSNENNFRKISRHLNYPANQNDKKN